MHLSPEGAEEPPLCCSIPPEDLARRAKDKGMASFKDKLAQFPPGSHFRMSTTKAVQEAHQAEIAEGERAAAASGQTIEILAPANPTLR
jgi:hypothetical protein